VGSTHPWLPPKLPTPLPERWVLVLAFVFLFYGVVGHDPWKEDDAVSIGVVWQLVSAGTGWWQPQVGDHLVAGKLPVFFWLSALVAKLGALSQLPVSMHGWVRLTAVAIYFITAVVVLRTARLIPAFRDSSGLAYESPPLGGVAVMFFLGAFGLLTRVHQASPESVVALAVALALYGSLRWQVNLSDAVGALLGLAGFALLGWQLALYALHAVQTPDHFGALAIASRYRFYLTTLAWFAFPLWPFALWWLWRVWRTPGLGWHPTTTFPLGLALLGMLVAPLLVPRSDMALIGLMPALALLAAPGAREARRNAAAGFDWFAAAGFTFAATVLWIYGAALMFGEPARAARALARLVPGYAHQIGPVSMTLAVVATLAWLVLLLRIARGTPRGSRMGSLRGVTRWFVGVVLVWVIGMGVTGRFFDFSKSYRSVVQQVASHVRAGECVRAQLSAAQFGAMAPLSPFSLKPFRDSTCTLVLAQRGQFGFEAKDWPAGKAEKLWEGARPGDKAERFVLYRIR
jgi:hypothetical protein